MLKANGVTAKPASKDGSNSDEKSSKTSPKRKSNGDAKPKRAAAKKVKAESSSPARSETPVKDETKDEDDQTVISGKCFRLQPSLADLITARECSDHSPFTPFPKSSRKFSNAKLTFSLAAQTLLSMTAMRSSHGPCDNAGHYASNQYPPVHFSRVVMMGNHC
jgi:hypothetical protein